MQRVLTAAFFVVFACLAVVDQCTAFPPDKPNNWKRQYQVDDIEADLQLLNPVGATAKRYRTDNGRHPSRKSDYESSDLESYSELNDDLQHWLSVLPDDDVVVRTTVHNGNTKKTSKDNKKWKKLAKKADSDEELNVKDAKPAKRERTARWMNAIGIGYGSYGGHGSSYGSSSSSSYGHGGLNNGHMSGGFGKK